MQRLDPVGSHDTDPFAVQDKPLLQQALSLSKEGDQVALREWVDSLSDEQSSEFRSQLDEAFRPIEEWLEEFTAVIKAAVSQVNTLWLTWWLTPDVALHRKGRGPFRGKGDDDD